MVSLPVCINHTLHAIATNYLNSLSIREYYLIGFVNSKWQCNTALRWRHYERDGVSNHRRLGRFLNRLFVRRSKKTSKLRVTGLCEGNSPVTGEFPSQRASNAENVSIWWRHHGSPPTNKCLYRILGQGWVFTTDFFSLRGGGVITYLCPDLSGSLTKQMLNLWRG